MRNDIKKLVSSAIAVIMTASMSATVFAADYGKVPSFPSAPSGSSSATSAEISVAVEKAEEKVKEAVDNAVANAVGSVDSDSDDTATASVEVKSVKSLTIKSTTIKDLVESGVTLEIVSPNATITINPDTVTKARKVDLSMKVVNSTARTKIDFKSKKDFGCEVQITLTACKMSAKKLANAHVYCDGEDLGAVELNDDGVPVITVTKGGEYEIK